MPMDIMEMADKSTQATIPRRLVISRQMSKNLVLMVTFCRDPHL